MFGDEHLVSRIEKLESKNRDLVRSVEQLRKMISEISEDFQNFKHYFESDIRGIETRLDNMNDDIKHGMG